VIGWNKFEGNYWHDDFPTQIPPSEKFNIYLVKSNIVRTIKMDIIHTFNHGIK
jgi:hypothetical protein